MKKILLFFAALVVALASCTDYQPTIDDLQKQIDDLKTENSKLNETVAGLQKVAEALQNNDKAVSIKPVTSNGVIQGYTVTFEEAGAVTVYNAKANVTIAADGGKYYWMVDGEWLKDSKGDKIPVVSETVVPQFKVENDALKVSVDNGSTWESVGAVAKPVIEKVEEFANKVEITLAGGSKIVIPKVIDLSVSFTAPEEMGAGQSADYTYTITGGNEETQVKAFAKDGWKAVVNTTDAASGTITVTAPTPFVPVNVLVFVSDGKGRTVVAELPSVEHGQDPELPDNPGGDDPDNPGGDDPDNPGGDDPEVTEDPVLTALIDSYEVGYEGGSIDVTISTNLEYTVSSDEEWAQYVQTKAVRQDVVVIRIDPNTDQKAREATISFESGDYFTSIAIVQEGAPEPVAGPNLSEKGTANCYIVPAAGEYYFNAKVMGCGQSGIVEDETARFHTDDAKISGAKTVEVLLNQNDVISDVRLENGNIWFKASGATGNAQIAVKDKYNELLWSWHIWCTPEVKTVTVVGTDFNDTEFEMMDRNLGSTSTDPTDLLGTYGAYYQWGRKDPFFPQNDFASRQSVNDDASILYAVQNPTSFFRSDLNKSRVLDWYSTRLNNMSYWLWGNPEIECGDPAELVKTIYDPCPVGYMVPPAEAMGNLGSCAVEYIEQGAYLTIEDEKVYFPFCGILSPRFK